jgi:hypothetical protein
LENLYETYGEGGKTYWMLKDLIEEFNEFENMEGEMSEDLKRLENLQEERRKSRNKED